MNVKTIKTDIDTERIYTELQTFVVNEDQFQDQMDDSHLSVQICLQGINAEMDPYFGSRTLKHIADEGFKEEDFNNIFFILNSLLREWDTLCHRIAFGT